ncbi:MAG: FeS-binding protein [Gammaproteobacteria bacterium]|nr:MAG: FeS-binding protein [Gammaproteobacteria bacterium]
MTQTFLCHKQDIPELKTRSFTIEKDSEKIELFLINNGDKILAYKNSCPHLGIPLNWQPDEFLSLEHTHIQCSTHGALFTLESGNCILGPCVGQSLEPLALDFHQNEIWLNYDS